MNAGAAACAIALLLFLIVGILFALLKGKAALLISGFNTLSQQERAQYDTDRMASDMRNSCFLWAAIMAIGCLLSWLVTPYLAIAAYIVWLVLFFKEVRSDPSDAFGKYRR